MTSFSLKNLSNRLLVISEIGVSVSFAISSSFSLSCFEILTPMWAMFRSPFIFSLLDMENWKEGLFNAVQRFYGFSPKLFSHRIKIYILPKTLKENSFFVGLCGILVGVNPKDVTLSPDLWPEPQKIQIRMV